jgi:hypothetical protein
MSTTEPTRSRRDFAAAERDDYVVEQYSPWLAFAAVMLAMLATLNFIDGIAAVSNSSFFVDDAKYILSGLNTWGWVLILVAFAQVITAFGVWARWPGVRWIGVTVAALNGVVQMLMMPAYPFWSMSLFAVDVLVIYALVAHGGRGAR